MDFTNPTEHCTGCGQALGSCRWLEAGTVGQFCTVRCMVQHQNKKLGISPPVCPSCLRPYTQPAAPQDGRGEK
jgi:hypothetical protein